MRCYNQVHKRNESHEERIMRAKPKIDTGLQLVNQKASNSPKKQPQPKPYQSSLAMAKSRNFVGQSYSKSTTNKVQHQTKPSTAMDTLLLHENLKIESLHTISSVGNRAAKMRSVGTECMNTQDESCSSTVHYPLSSRLPGTDHSLVKKGFKRQHTVSGLYNGYSAGGANCSDTGWFTNKESDILCLRTRPTFFINHMHREQQQKSQYRPP